MEACYQFPLTAFSGDTGPGCDSLMPRLEVKGGEK